MILTNLDLDALRTLTMADDLGGFSHAAARLGRTPSAISLQMKRLQEAVGVPLFRREGRKTLLTEQGEIALRYARRVLELNDEMLDTLRGASQSGSLRIGFAQDFVDAILPQALARFTAMYPLIQLEVFIERSTSLEELLNAGKLDLALMLNYPAKKHEAKIADLPLKWVGSQNYSERSTRPLPLVLFEPPCIFRSRALDALDHQGRPWRIAMTSPSIAGLWAAVRAGLGLTARAYFDLPSALQVMDSDLPPLGDVSIILQRRRNLRAAHALRLAEITEELVRAKLDSKPR